MNSTSSPTSTSTASVAESERTWWKESVFYEIYPRSFYDSNDNGVGDLPGIVRKLDYLDDLGVDVVWLTPVYDSPQADFGYDIRDYRDILDEYGTMDDWERLRDGLHERDMRLVMDLVVNHTSDEHEWFEKSRREVDPYTDYYIWREGDPEAGSGDPYDPDALPNNWDSLFGGPAWTYDERRGEYYLHLFDGKQPDLNWRNPAVREDVYGIMRWWLDRDIDGFRMDVINFISKADGLPDGDPSAVVTGSEHFINGPHACEYLREMDERVLSEYDVVTVGEMPGISVEDAREYVGRDGPLDMAFHFEHMRLDEGPDDPWNFRDWSLDDFRETFTRWQTGLAGEGWNALYLNNHDQPRMVSRFGDEAYRVESATMLATFLHTLRGSPFVYQGEEIGMTNVPFESAGKFVDVETLRYVERMLERDDVENFEDIGDAVRYGSRDNARTPMQWSDAPNAGFTDREPWLTVNPNYTEVNVESARADPDSVWHYYRRLIDLRHDAPVLVYGDYEPLLPDHPEIYAYRRTLEDVGALVVLNFFDGEPRFDLPGSVAYDGAELLISNYEVERPEGPDGFDLRPYEARVYRLE
ncbi:glycoside hydrolase family 13 protein [Halorarum salinum]|uniref:Alpha-glucosidase n=1 Tax=Halorarum salinum TaxID=2743089 RepID=A0A7D5QBQ5_9EURY|nr:alpha-glucosidase [Halobaculum salinum]QLG63596.1 alpha-glucosidase [Halobaculum salinum]